MDKRLVDLEILACLHAAAAQNALIWVVAVERIGMITSDRLVRNGMSLVLDVEHFGGVVDCAVAVVVVANRAVELMIAQDAIEGLALRGIRASATVVTTFMPAVTMVPQARTSLPSTSTMQVSQVSIGPNWG